MQVIMALLLLLICFIEIPVINANSVDPDLIPHSMASSRFALFANYLLCVCVLWAGGGRRGEGLQNKMVKDLRERFHVWTKSKWDRFIYPYWSSYNKTPLNDVVLSLSSP